MKHRFLMSSPSTRPNAFQGDKNHSPAALRAAATLLVALGLGLALWLALLKWRSLPCIGGGCEQVIHSRFGAVFGVPVGAVGAVVWLALFFPWSARWRTAWHGALALGAIGFMVVQFGVLKAFCPYCTAHAAAAVMAWPRRAVRPAQWGLGLALAFALGGYALALRAAERHAAAAGGRPAALTAGADAFLPLDETPPVAGTRPVLVLSVTCPACLDLLAAVTLTSWPAGKIGPAIYIKTDAKDRALAAVWLAACTETNGSSPRDRFMAVTAMLVGQRDVMASDPAATAEWLAGIFRPSAAARQAAEQALAQHTARLVEAGVVTTPTLWPAEGAARVTITPTDLWR